MKWLMFITVLAVIESCAMPIDMQISNMINKSELYYADYSSIKTYSDISKWIHINIYYKPDVIDTFSSPQEIILRGYGDCDDYSILFMNITYIVFGIKADFIVVDSSNMRTLVAGGTINHTLVSIDGELFEPQLGQFVEYSSIGYIYSFDDFFYY